MVFVCLFVVTVFIILLSVNKVLYCFNYVLIIVPLAVSHHLLHPQLINTFLGCNVYLILEFFCCWIMCEKS